MIGTKFFENIKLLYKVELTKQWYATSRKSPFLHRASSVKARKLFAWNTTGKQEAPHSHLAGYNNPMNKV